jgi:hypothetical protein
LNLKIEMKVFSCLKNLSNDVEIMQKKTLEVYSNFNINKSYEEI